MCRKPIGHGLFLRCLLGDAGGDACVGIGLDFLLRMTGFVIPGGMQWSVGIFPLFSQCDPAGRRPAMCGRKRMIIIAHSAQLSPHCTGGGIRSDGGSSARSGCAKQRSLLCPLSERRCRHPLLFAVLDLLVLLDQDKSTEEKNTRQKKSILREEFRREDRLHRICGSKSAEHAHSGGLPRAEASARAAQRRRNARLRPRGRPDIGDIGRKATRKVMRFRYFFRTFVAMNERLIFLTNDDGFDSRGMEALIDIARRFGRVVRRAA